MSVDLTLLHPRLVSAIAKVLSGMKQAGHPMRITDGLRTVQQQAKLYAQGRTTPGRKVTHCDGIRYRSNHQAGADGFGRAVDCAFLGDEPYAETHPWHLYGEMVRREGLKWGGDWGHPDRPHAELPAELPPGALVA